MSTAFGSLSRSQAAVPGWRHRIAVALLTAVHMAALTLLILSEHDLVSRLVFALAWGLVNCVWLMLLRRPLAAGLLTLALALLLILLSRFKHDVLLMTVTFLDILLIDRHTIAFLLKVFPDLSTIVTAVVAALMAATALLWWLDPYRVRIRAALFGGTGCLVGLSGLALTLPNDLYDDFVNGNYVSKFVRSGVTGVFDLWTRGYIEADETADTHLPADSEPCRPAGRPPHIVMVFDESSFDIRRLPGVAVPPGYGGHFKSFDGKARVLLVEGAGGPSWYTEYNVLTGLSVRSFGRFADYVTRVAAGRVERGLPRALRRCGYRTFSLYPMWGSFADARGFQTTAGIKRFLDAHDLGSDGVEPDSFYYDAATRLIARERGGKPLFLFVYTAANHFPWTYRFRPELTPDWRRTANELEVDEYLRRQHMSAGDWRDFVARLKREFPDEAFLLVRFGDHQPSFAKRLVDPSLDDSVLSRRIAEADPRYLATYYAIDAINHRPVDLSAALDVLDAPYLPLVVLEAAGLPLDPSFAEQKRILERCGGTFYRCASGAEARRFNRLLIDAGLIKAPPRWSLFGWN